MEGKDEPPELRGLIPNTFRYVFEIIARDSGTKEFLVRSSYLEIYNEEVTALAHRLQRRIPACAHTGTLSKRRGSALRGSAVHVGQVASHADCTRADVLLLSLLRFATFLAKTTRSRWSSKRAPTAACT
jgi:hypothetical protein